MPAVDAEIANGQTSHDEGSTFVDHPPSNIDAEPLLRSLMEQVEPPILPGFIDLLYPI